MGEKETQKQRERKISQRIIDLHLFDYFQMKTNHQIFKPFHQQSETEFSRSNNWKGALK